MLQGTHIKKLYRHIDVAFPGGYASVYLARRTDNTITVHFIERYESGNFLTAWPNEYASLADGFMACSAKAEILAREHEGSVEPRVCFTEDAIPAT